MDERELSVVWPRVHGLLRYLRIVQHGALGYSVHIHKFFPERTWPGYPRPVPRSFRVVSSIATIAQGCAPLGAADIIPLAHERRARKSVWWEHDHAQDMAPFAALGVVKHLMERVVPRRPPLGRHVR